MRVIIASVVLIFVTGFAEADGLYNGNELLSQCVSSKQFVAGYVAGEIDKAKADYAPMMVLFLGFYDKTKHAEHTKKLESSATLIEGYCIPNGVTLGQMTDVFCKYLGENPASRHESGASLIRSSLLAAWPCDK